MAAAPTTAPFPDAAVSVAIESSLVAALAMTRIKASNPRKMNQERGE